MRPLHSLWPERLRRPYPRTMRSLPLLPLAMLVLAALLSSNNSWAGPESEIPTEGIDEAKDDEHTTKAPEEAKESAKDKLVQLTKERDHIMLEIAALEEGYSELPGKDGKEAKESQLQKRLTTLTAELEELDKQIAELEDAK